MPHMKIVDIEGAREVTVTSIGSAIFVEGPDGLCYEYDRAVFLAAFKEEFHLVTDWSVGALLVA